MEKKDIHKMEKPDNTPEFEEQGTDISTDASIDEKDEKIATLQSQLDELKDKYLRQAAEFDNLRKRTARERIELMQTAGKEVISALLVVLDDCERAEKQLQTSQNIDEIREGVLLVFNKLRNTLQARGLKAMEVVGTDFDADKHEAITEIPAATPDQVGKVVAEVERGYLLNDKIIRFAKVVVGK